MSFLFFSTASIYTANPTGGIRRYRELVEYHNKKGDIVVCSMDDSFLMKSHGINNHIQIKEGCATGWYKLLPPIYRIFVTNRGVISKLNHNGFDKVVVFDIPPTLGLISWGFKNIIMLVRKDLISYELVSSKGSILKYCKVAIQWVWELICLLKTKKIICQCNFDKDLMKGRHPMLHKLIDKKVFIQINNVNPSWIVSNSTTSEGFIELDQNFKYRVCFIGGFDDARKGQDFFLNTALSILEEKDDFEFILIGGGAKLNHYKNSYNQKGIVFLGRLDNPLNVLKQCDLLIVPSLADSCPNTVMEALYNDVLVLGSKRGGIPEILKDEESLFDLEVVQLKEKILKIKSEPVYQRMIKELQKNRKSQLSFNWAEIITRLI